MEIKKGLTDDVDDEETLVMIPIDLDDILVNEVGQFGWFQLKNILLAVLPIMSSAIFSDFIFVAAAIPYRCKIPECEKNGDAIFMTSWISNAIPYTDDGFSKCERFGSNAISGAPGDCPGDCCCPATLFNRSDVFTCKHFVYETDTTLVSDFNLGCQEWLRVMAGSVLSLGGLFSLPIAGYISDRFGRRVILAVSLFNFSLIGVIRAASVNYSMFLFLQFLWELLANGTYSSAYVFATELVGPKRRVVVSSVCSSMYALGHVMLSCIAWLVRPWRYLILVLCLPCFLLVSYYWVLPETVRWLISKHKFKEAKIVLEKAAKTNGNKISDKSIQALIKQSELRNTSKNGNKQDSALILNIFRSPVLLRRILITPIWWLVTTLVGYSLSINSASLSGSMYLNFIFVNLMEIGGSFSSIFLLDRIGRRTTLFCGFIMSSICNFAFAFIKKEMSVVRLIFYLLGKLGISAVFSSMYLYTAELYPTQYRHTLLALSSTVGTIGYITAPLTPLLINYWEGLPSVLFGGISLIAAVLVLTQPETLGSKLPDTLAEAEALGKSQIPVTIPEEFKLTRSQQEI